MEFCCRFKCLHQRSFSICIDAYDLFFENFFAFLIFIPLIVKRGSAILKTKKPYLILIRSFFGLATYYFLFLSLRYIPLADAALLNNSAPLFVPFILWIWIKKKIPKKQLLGIIIEFIGVGFILHPEKQIFSYGAFIGLSSGTCAALVMVMMRLLSSESPTTIIIYYLFSTAAFLFPFLFLNWNPLPFHAWILLISSGILMFLAQVFFTQSFKYACATDLGPFSYTFVIIAGILDWIIWKNIPTIFSLIGILFVILGGTITILFSSTKKSLD